MNQKFLQLTEEKQLKIINAGLEVFSQFDYKKASTEAIAYKAGISKGLLFHYFHNKETFFKYLYLYVQSKMRNRLSEVYEDTKGDFFQVIERITQAKCSLLEESPYIFNFLIMATYSKDETVQKVLLSTADQLCGDNILNQIPPMDYDMFNEDVNPAAVIEMLAYTLEGYLYQQLKLNRNVQLEEIMEKYKIWISILKKACYK